MIVELDQVASLKNGYAFKSADYQENGIPVIRIADIKSENVEVSNETAYLSSDVAGTYKEFLIDRSDILVALSGATTGKFGVYNDSQEALLNQRVGRLRSKDENVLLPKYLFFSLFQLQDEIFRKARGGAQPNISLSEIGKLEINLPDLQTQRQIVATLDKAKDLIDKRQRSIEMLEEVLKATFLEMFGDSYRNPLGFPISKLKDIVKPDKIITYGIVQAGPEYDGGVPYIRSGDIKENRIIGDQLRKTSPEIARSYERSKCSTGDIIMSIRATVGSAAILPEELDGCNLTQGTARISPDNSKVNTNYLFNLILSKGFQAKIENNTKGATFREITLGRLRDIEAPIAPLDLQEKFDLAFEQYLIVREKLELSLKSSQELFQSLLQRAFHGDLSFKLELQLDAFLENEDYETISKDGFLIQELVDRFNQHNQQNGATDGEEKAFKFETIDDYEKAKNILFSLLKDKKVMQVYDEENKLTKLSMP